jgi:hypothetical protein
VTCRALAGLGQRLQRLAVRNAVTLCIARLIAAAQAVTRLRFLPQQQRVQLLECRQRQ